MCKHFYSALFFTAMLSATHGQSVSENLVVGSWQVIRWETKDRMLDFQDTAASFRYMVDEFKHKNKVLGILKEDSIRIKQELLKIMTVADAIRFKLHLNKDRSFTWTGNSNNTAQYKGTYSVTNNSQELVLTSFDVNTKAYRTMPIKVHTLHNNQMTIEIPSEEPGFKQSKFILKRL
jgi:hypothetical protein